jgi:hypothetical protein
MSTFDIKSNSLLRISTEINLSFTVSNTLKKSQVSPEVKKTARFGSLTLNVFIHLFDRSFF